ncbi:MULTISPECIES: serine/threonine-protein kinase [unclassified Duganella]|jgi:serine/threonine protein kinase|uniref:serine/threonine-protein kinase n=1 Tax=unclassified Duganella TaxID=2636909 RepID=UPI000883D355|nr:MULTISPECIES: serine/threonine-protein kinase [unclassified Duganella]SDF63505.1 serine/threonine protein kinase [Duganella sp. OV458]SDI64942.1 serine/threonine protein kinase [Duganella sp. OV510]
MTTADAIIALELGHYRLREQIGGSAYGIIWRASGPQATRDVAVKLINQEQMDRALPAQRERWTSSAHNEIAFLQSLEPWDERHIVRLMDSGWHDGLPVLALELMGSDLGKHMIALKGRGESLPLTRALNWIAQINQALAKVHQYGWRYLDLKPANVLLDPHLHTVKLADFGTNRELGSLQAHSYAGTANWQAPEQFFPTNLGGYATSARSDYFSLGAMLYFLVTGGMPLRFCADCGLAYREHHVAGADLLRSRNGGEIPSALQLDEEERFAAAIAQDKRDAALDLLRALLHIDPAQRPRHAIQISRMLNAIQGVKPARGEFDAVDPVLGMHRPSAINGWQTMRAA